MNSKNSLLRRYTLPKFLIACRATTFAKVEIKLIMLVKHLNQLVLRPLPKFLIACRATTFAKLDCSDNQSIVWAFCKRPYK